MSDRGRRELLRDKPPDRSSDKTSPGSETSTSEPKGQELAYSMRVSLDRTQMDVDGKLVKRGPGMAVTVEMKTGSRRNISYLLSPLLNVCDHIQHNEGGRNRV